MKSFYLFKILLFRENEQFLIGVMLMYDTLSLKCAALVTQVGILFRFNEARQTPRVPGREGRGR